MRHLPPCSAIFTRINLRPLLEPVALDFPPADFDFEEHFTYRDVVQLSPLVSRVLAKNPSPFTFSGTGTYIIGTDSVAVIDPGPDSDEHLEALLGALQGKTVSHILITHTHLDHSPLAAKLKAAVGAKTYGYGPHGSGRKGGLDGEEVEAGADKSFTPDVVLKDGDILRGHDWTLEAVYTPGHTSNHVCFALSEENCLFSGDHVMGWSTTVISPPDGDMKAYLESLDKVASRDETLYYPTHGDPITKARRFARGILGHRRQREQQILSCIKKGMHTIDQMVPDMYKAVNPVLHPAAARSALAHLIAMTDDGRVICDGSTHIDSEYFIAN